MITHLRENGTPLSLHENRAIFFDRAFGVAKFRHEVIGKYFHHAIFFMCFLKYLSEIPVLETHVFTVSCKTFFQFFLVFASCSIATVSVYFVMSHASFFHIMFPIIMLFK